MAEAWCTYGDLAESLGMRREAVRQRAIRARERRQFGTDGHSRVKFGTEAGEHFHEQPHQQRVGAALEAHIAALREVVAKSEVRGELRRQEVEAANRRVDMLVADLIAMAANMSEIATALDRLHAEFEAYRTRPWWRRWAD
jgi:hypothetical protein